MTATRHVESLARCFNHKELAVKGAPRAKHVIEQLEKLESKSRELADLLSQLDDVTRLQLQTGGTGVGDFLLCCKTDPDLDAEGLPRPSPVHHYGRWIARLNALSNYTAFCTAQFCSRQQIGEGEPADRGGNTNMYKQMVGSGRFALVRDGLAVFDQFKPGVAKGTEGGEFHAFLMDVFEYATGLDPEEHSKLVPWVKKLPKAYRRMAQIEDEKSEIAKKIDDMREQNYSPAEYRRQADELHKRVVVLEHEKTPLSHLIFQA